LQSIIPAPEAFLKSLTAFAEIVDIVFFHFIKTLQFDGRRPVKFGSPGQRSLEKRSLRDLPDQ